MRIAIWQQFSSNHSASFTVLGVFKTPQKATEAAEKLNDIIQTINLWYKNNPEKAAAVWDNPNYPDQPAPSEIEKQLGLQYGIDWKVAVEWHWNAKVEVQFGHLLVVRPTRQVEYGPEPLERLIDKWEGQAIVTGQDWNEPHGALNMDVECERPSEEVIEAIKAKLSTWVDDEENFGITIHEKKLEIGWYQAENVEDFLGLIEYLQSQGCKSIEFRLLGIRYTPIHSVMLPSTSEDKP